MTVYTNKIMWWYPARQRCPATSVQLRRVAVLEEGRKDEGHCVEKTTPFNTSKTILKEVFDADIMSGYLIVFLRTRPDKASVHQTVTNKVFGDEKGSPKGQSKGTR